MNLACTDASLRADVVSGELLKVCASIFSIAPILVLTVL